MTHPVSLLPAQSVAYSPLMSLFGCTWLSCNPVQVGTEVGTVVLPATFRTAGTWNTNKTSPCLNRGKGCPWVNKLHSMQVKGLEFWSKLPGGKKKRAEFRLVFVTARIVLHLCCWFKVTNHQCLIISSFTLYIILLNSDFLMSFLFLPLANHSFRSILLFLSLCVCLCLCTSLK